MEVRSEPLSLGDLFEGLTSILKPLTEANKPQAITSCSPNAGISFSEVYYNRYSDSWRVVLKLEPHNQDPVDIRCTLQKGEEVLGETWTYHWSPP